MELVLVQWLTLVLFLQLPKPPVKQFHISSGTQLVADLASSQPVPTISQTLLVQLVPNLMPILHKERSVTHVQFQHQPLQLLPVKMLLQLGLLQHQIETQSPMV